MRFNAVVLFLSFFLILRLMVISLIRHTACRKKLSTILTKFSHIYKKRSQEHRTKEYVCASKDFEVIYMIGYCTYNIILRTIWVNKKCTIFHHKLLFFIKICMDFGTLLIHQNLVMHNFYQTIFVIKYFRTK